MNYRDNKFYNVALPIILFVLMILFIYGWFVTSQIIFVILAMIDCIIFKCVHHWLEILSIKKQQDNEQ